MSNRNPFEIRTDILAMAKDYLDRKYDVDSSFAQQAFEKMIEDNPSLLDKPENWKNFMPEMYNVDELNKVAQHMYDFVSNKSE
jgi:hypothetical protein